VWDLDATGTPSIFKIIRSAAALARILPIFDFRWWEDVTTFDFFQRPFFFQALIFFFPAMGKSEKKEKKRKRDRSPSSESSESSDRYMKNRVRILSVGLRTNNYPPA
jgi:hypothetical protein